MSIARNQSFFSVDQACVLSHTRSASKRLKQVKTIKALSLRTHKVKVIWIALTGKTDHCVALKCTASWWRWRRWCHSESGSDGQIRWYCYGVNRAWTLRPRKFLSHAMLGLWRRHNLFSTLSGISIHSSSYFTLPGFHCSTLWNWQISAGRLNMFCLTPRPSSGGVGKVMWHNRIVV